MQGVVTILSKDADLTMQIMKFGGAVLLVLVIFGAVLELKRSFRGIQLSNYTYVYLRV